MPQNFHKKIKKVSEVIADYPRRRNNGLLT